MKQIDLWGIDMVFVVGGNGGNAGAAAIQEELEKNNILCRCGWVGWVGVAEARCSFMKHAALYETCSTSALAGHLQFECLTLLLFGPAILPGSVVGVPKSIGAKAGRVQAPRLHDC